MRSRPQSKETERSMPPHPAQVFHQVFFCCFNIPFSLRNRKLVIHIVTRCRWIHWSEKTAALHLKVSPANKSEQWLQKFHTDDVSLPRGSLTNQKHYPDLPWVVTRQQYGISALVPQTSFCEQTSGQWCREMSAVFSGREPIEFFFFILNVYC